MVETVKVYSKELNANFRISVFLPINYSTSINAYKASFFITNEKLDDKNIIDSIYNNNVILVNIYPDKQTEKNYLLYDIYNEKVNYEKIFERFIIEEILPYVINRYKITTDMYLNSIVGLNETCLLVFDIATRYKDTPKTIVLFGFNSSIYKNKFLVDLRSSFNPNIKYFISKNETTLEIENTLKDFGAKEFNTNIDHTIFKVI